jgi:hypothetical protein
VQQHVACQGNAIAQALCKYFLSVAQTGARQSGTVTEPSKRKKDSCQLEQRRNETGISGVVLQTERSKLAGALVTAARRAVLLSGTPALNRPRELFTQVLACSRRRVTHGRGCLMW